MPYIGLVALGVHRINCKTTLIHRTVKYCPREQTHQHSFRTRPVHRVGQWSTDETNLDSLMLAVKRRPRRLIRMDEFLALLFHLTWSRTAVLFFAVRLSLLGPWQQVLASRKWHGG